MKLINSVQHVWIVLTISAVVRGNIDEIFEDEQQLKDLSVQYNTLRYRIKDAISNLNTFENSITQRYVDIANGIEDGIRKYGSSLLKQVSRRLQSADVLPCVTSSTPAVKAVAQQASQYFINCIEALKLSSTSFVEEKNSLESYLSSRNLKDITKDILKCKQDKETQVECDKQVLQAFTAFINELSARGEQFSASIDVQVAGVLKCYQTATNKVSEVYEELKIIKDCVANLNIELNLNSFEPPRLIDLIPSQYSLTSKSNSSNLATLIAASTQLELLYNKIVQENFNTFLQDELVNLLNANLEESFAYIRKLEENANPLTLFCLKIAQLKLNKIKEDAFNTLKQSGNISLVEAERKIKSLLEEAQAAIAGTFGAGVSFPLLGISPNSEISFNDDVLNTVAYLRNGNLKIHEKLVQSVFNFNVKSVLYDISVNVTNARNKLSLCFYRFGSVV